MANLVFIHKYSTLATLVHIDTIYIYVSAMDKLLFYELLQFSSVYLAPDNNMLANSDQQLIVSHKLQCDIYG